MNLSDFINSIIATPTESNKKYDVVVVDPHSKQYSVQEVWLRGDDKIVIKIDTGND